jgi:hypothetical protein
LRNKRAYKRPQTGKYRDKNKWKQLEPSVYPFLWEETEAIDNSKLSIPVSNPK